MFSNNKIVWIAAILMWGNSFCSNDVNKIINTLAFLQQKGIVPLDPCRTCPGREIRFTSMRSHCRIIHQTRLCLQLFDEKGDYVHKCEGKNRMQPFLAAAGLSNASKEILYFKDDTSHICALNGYRLAIEISIKQCKGAKLKRLQDQTAKNAQLRLLRKMVQRFDEGTLENVTFVSRKSDDHIKGLRSLSDVLKKTDTMSDTMQRIIGNRPLNELYKGMQTRIAAVKAKK